MNLDELKEIGAYLIDNGIELDTRYDVDQFIGKGSFAVVYKVQGKDKVIKIHNAKENYDFEKYDKLIDKNFKNVVNVFYNKEVTVNNKNVGITVLEYLEPLKFPKLISISLFIAHLEDEYHQSKDYSLTKQYFKYIIDAIISYKNDLRGGSYSSQNGMQAIKKIFQEYESNKELLFLMLKCIKMYIIDDFDVASGKINSLEFIADYPEFFRDIYKGIKEFETIGERHDDLHIGNILKDPKTNKYKLIDPI